MQRTALAVVRPDRHPELPEGASDEEIMARIVAGDTAAVGAIYDRYGQLAFSLALRLTRDPGKAEDVVQDAFLALWRQVDRFDTGRGSVRTWLLSIVHHRAVDSVRAARHLQQPDSESETMETLPDDTNVEFEVIRRIEGRRLRQALRHLPPEQLRVVELAYFGGYTYPEIAGMLRIPLGTVKSRLRIALQKLRDAPELAWAYGATS